ncbi:unnamed protein product [Cuscuta campestris]|uniref:SOSEKI DIX-like domain-containing protein n=1 Tax=Cuscuta campestris TaxID=132261 RepID=A0A484LLF4_9ASTE|nr:unnamed protein product [Cuscuta campestris]
MAARSERRTDLHIMSKRWKDPDLSPEPPRRRAAVVYYLSRNGHLQHPHFMEVPFSSSRGLYLRDVIYRLNSLRGKGMASLYSWSAKRRYKNGFVWQDLAEGDFIHPTSDEEYVLKGSEILDGILTPGGEEFELPAAKGHRDKPLLGSVEEEEEDREEALNRSQRTELSGGEISPSGSSPETLERLMKAGGRVILVNESQTEAKFETSVNTTKFSCFKLGSLFLF